MKFYPIFDGQKHRVMFKHIFGDMLAVLSINVNGTWLPIDEDLASCNPNDQYNKWFGRKLALSRLAKRLKPEFRKELWTKYFEAIAEELVNKKSNFPNTACGKLMHYTRVTTAWKEAINPKCHTFTKVPIKRLGH